MEYIGKPPDNSSDGQSIYILKLALKTYQDLYHLDRYRNEIIALEGCGEKSYENLIASINESRNTTFVRFVAAMDILLIGRTACTWDKGYSK